MKSIEVTLKLLEALAAEKSGVSVLDIARKISFSKSTTHRALQVLENEKFAEKDPLSGRYRSGARMLDLAFHFISNFDLRSLAHPILQDIVSQVNETAYLCVYTQEHLFFVDIVECSHPVRYINPVGRRQHMHAGAAGKAIMAFLPGERIDQILARGLPSFTQNTITEIGRLKRELKKIRNNGYAFSRSEFAEGGIAIAAPIINSESSVIGCIDIVIPVDRFNDEKRSHFIKVVKKGARKVEDLLVKSSSISTLSA